jgi:hypothetical protein
MKTIWEKVLIMDTHKNNERISFEIKEKEIKGYFLPKDMKVKDFLCRHRKYCIEQYFGTFDFESSKLSKFYRNIDEFIEHTMIRSKNGGIIIKMETQELLYFPVIEDGGIKDSDNYIIKCFYEDIRAFGYYGIIDNFE